MNLPIGRESGGQRLLSLKAESCKQRFDFNVNVFSSINIYIIICTTYSTQNTYNTIGDFIFRLKSV